MSVLPPELYGIDPDETWEFTPKAYRGLPEADKLVVTLRSPDAALDHLIESEDAKIHAAVRKAIPETIQALTRLSRKIDAARKANGRPDLPEAECLTPQEQAEREGSINAWAAYFALESEKSDRVELLRRVFAQCITSIKGLCNRSGKPLIVADPKKYIDALPKQIRVEIFEAINQGIQITSEEKASLT